MDSDFILIAAGFMAALFYKFKILCLKYIPLLLSAPHKKFMKFYEKNHIVALYSRNGDNYQIRFSFRNHGWCVTYSARMPIDSDGILYGQVSIVAKEYIKE